MTVWSCNITAAQRIRFDRKPTTDKSETDMIDELKQRGFRWNGYGDNGKWLGPKELVIVWEDKAFRQRVKSVVAGLGLRVASVARQAREEIRLICASNAFDPDALDDSLDDMAASSVLTSAPVTPAKPSPSQGTSKRNARAPPERFRSTCAANAARISCTAETRTIRAVALARSNHAKDLRKNAEEEHAPRMQTGTTEKNCHGRLLS